MQLQKRTNIYDSTDPDPTMMSEGDVPPPPADEAMDKQENCLTWLELGGLGSVTTARKHYAMVKRGSSNGNKNKNNLKVLKYAFNMAKDQAAAWFSDNR